MKVRTILALSLAFVAPPGSLLGQTPYPGATVYGTVMDQSGGALPGATMTVMDPERRVYRAATSNHKGYYSVPGLYPGTYGITAELHGFRTEKRQGVELQMGRSVRQDFVLQLSARGEEVTVHAVVPLLDTTQTAVSSVVALDQIENLPLIGRTFAGLSALVPGVTPDDMRQTGALATSGLSFAGQRARSNGFLVDGFDNSDGAVGSGAATVSPEAVRELQVLANSYSAEFGKATGGVVSITTKRGGNSFGGSAFWYFRDDKLKAKDHFERFDVFGDPIERDKAPLKQNLFGGTLGGPIWKDKTFFFLSLERDGVQANNFVTISDGDAAVLSAAGFPVQTGANRFDLEQTLLLGRVDHNWSEDSSLYLRANYSAGRNQNVEPFGGLVARSRGAEQDRKDWAFSAAQTNVLSRRWVSRAQLINEARAQYVRQEQTIDSLDPNCGGPCLGNDQGGPSLEVLGVASVGRQRFTPQRRVSDRTQISDTVSIFAGGHQAKAGFDFNWIDSHDQALPLHFGGRYLFAPRPAIPGLLPAPITAIQAVERGFPIAYVQGYGQDSVSHTYKDLSIFVQDEWRVWSRLTMKAGVRYQKQFWPEVAYDVSNVNGTRFRYAFPSDSNNFAPRVAFAFDPKGDGKTSLHAAYGIFFDNHVTGIAGITDAIDGSAGGVRTLVATLPSPLVLAAWRAPGHRLTEEQALALLGGAYPSLVISIDPGLRTPYAHHVAAGFDRELARDFELSANFVYVHGKHQLGTIDYNPVLPSALGPGRRPNDVGGRAGTSASVLQYTSFGETWYRGLTLSLRKRLSHRYQFLASYTLGKAEDNSTDFQSQFLPQDSGAGRNSQDPTGLPTGFDPLLERGPAAQGQRHRLVLSGLCQLPRHFQLSAIITAASGRPFTPIAGSDLNGDGDGDALPGPDRARGATDDINTSVGRNSANLPNQFIVDMRLSKGFKLGGRRRLELIVEAFNLFDRVNYVDVNNVFGTGRFPAEPQRDGQGRITYGTFTVALPPRQVQLAARLAF